MAARATVREDGAVVDTCPRCDATFWRAYDDPRDSHCTRAPTLWARFKRWLGM